MTETELLQKKVKKHRTRYHNLLRTHRALLVKEVEKEDEMRILHMQNIALQMMVADDYEKYEIWRMTLNKAEKDEWLAAVKDLKNNVFDRWLKVTT